MPGKIYIYLSAILSLLFFRVVSILSRPFVYRVFKPIGESTQWHPLSEWIRDRPLGFYTLMLVAPRWNCGGLLGLTDLFKVKSHITLRTDQATNSSQDWTAVIYDKDFNTITHVGKKKNNSQSTLTIDLPHGEYLLGIRYYVPKSKCKFPEITIDNSITISARDSSQEEQNYKSFIDTIIDKHSSFFYYCMHYHTWGFLTVKNWLSEPWVKKLYLPVGNPETGFTFGAVRKGDVLTLSRSIEDNELIYFCIYNCMSLPVYWDTLNQSVLDRLQIDFNGTWLVRRITIDTGIPIYILATAKQQ